MEFQLLASSLALAVICILPIAAKWQIKIRVAIIGAIVIGLVTAIVVSQVNSRFQLGLSVLLLIELLSISLIAGLAILLRFYRDPERYPPDEDGVILSPADGEVLYTKRIDSKDCLVATKGGKRIYLAEIVGVPWPFNNGYLVGISMNLLNVHVNRAPVSGKIALQKYTRGGFLSLRKPEAEVLNERMTTVIDGGGFQVAVVQIASRLVRAIVSYVKEGDRVKLGQRVGMIRFGSQVDLIISEMKDCRLTVRPGDKVTAGVSVIARYDTHGAQQGIGRNANVRT